MMMCCLLNHLLCLVRVGGNVEHCIGMVLYNYALWKCQHISIIQKIACFLKISVFIPLSNMESNRSLSIEGLPTLIDLLLNGWLDSEIVPDDVDHQFEGGFGCAFPLEGNGVNQSNFNQSVIIVLVE